MREPSQGSEPPWDLVAERIDAFAAAWDAAEAASATPPRLDEFTAALDSAVERLLLLELVKLDLERRWQLGRDPRHIEWYVQEFPALGAVGKLPVEVLYEELQARMGAGLPVYQDEVQQRFPVQAESLLRLVGGLAVSGSPTATYNADTVIDPKPAPAVKNGGAPFNNLKPGDQLDDFQLLSPLGSGAFARVFLARQASMERLVALKISAHTGSEPQTLAQLDHPHIVRVYDQRCCAQPPARLLYMEVIAGGTLQDVIARARNTYDGKPSGRLLLDVVDDRLSAVGAPIPENSASRDWIDDAAWPEVVARLGAELAEGLAYAHGRGVLHRDIKPANVLLSAEARPKLADFNVSFNGGRADENPEDTFGGSLAYMSPEQLEACHPLLGGSPRSVREASDIYAVGVLLWEMLAGRRPFRDEQATADGRGSLVRLQRMIDARRQANLAQLAAQLPDECPPALRDVLLKCLANDKANRYQSADELARALRLCLNPHCWRLLQPPRSRLGKFALRHPVLAVVLAGLIPNLITAAFNLLYNRWRFMTNAELAPLYDRFMQVQFWVNGIAFPVGVGVGAWVAIGTLSLAASKQLDGATLGSTRVFKFGQFISLLILCLWTASGLAFPIALGQFGGHSVSLYLHFFLSLALCGIAATAYPYLLITALAVRYFVPEMVRRGLITGPRRQDLAYVAKTNRVYTVVSALVPMLGMLLVTMFNSGQNWALVAVSGGGMAGFAAMIALERIVGLDIAALNHIALDEPRRHGSPRSSRKDGSGFSRRSGRA